MPNLRATIARRLASEIGVIRKDPGGRLRVCLVYPNTYRVGMSSLGFQTVYHLLNSEPSVVCERGFLPDKEDLEEAARTGGELISYESQTPLQAFDVIAFSISYELDYINLPRLLRLAKLPARVAEREEHHPLVIAGGPVTSINPAPLADLIDWFVVGELEPQLTEVIASARECRSERDVGAPVEIASARKGRSGTRHYLQDLDAWPTHSRILTPETEFGDLFLVEIGRGCARRCKFCVTPSCYWPLRFRSVGAVLESARAGLKHRKAIGLIGAAVSDHPEIDEIATRIVGLGARLSVSSLRADSVSDTLLKALASSGARSLTLAPEAGSEQLRLAIGKDITDAQILEALARAARAGMREAKLYFMIGLPGEGEEDVAAIPTLVRRALRESGLARLTVAAGAFVPKMGTPYEHETMPPVAELSRRLREIRDALRGERRVRLAMESVNWSWIEGILAGGGRELGELLIAAEARGGGLGAWRLSLEERGMKSRSH